MPHDPSFFGPSFWVGVSFIIFVILAFKPVGRILLKSLDDRTDKIQNELNEAVRLKEEAQALLDSYKNKHKEIELEAKEIVSFAQEESSKILAKAEEELEQFLGRRIQIYMQKMENQEHAAMQAMRANIIDAMVDSVRLIISKNINQKSSEELIKQVISDLSKSVH